MIYLRFTTFVFGVMLFWVSSPVVNSQDQSASRHSRPEMLPKNLRSAPGKLLATGKNRIPVGELRVITYRLEEVPLADALVVVDQQNSRVKMEKALRLTVTLDHLVSDQYTIWVNDDGYLAVRTNENEITALIIGTQGLENSANITVKRGVDCNVTARSTLPEKLVVPKGWRRTDPTISPNNFVRRIHSVPSSTTSGGQDNIAIDVMTSRSLPVRNAGMILQIGEQEFEGDPDRLASNVFRFTISASAFARAREGDLIKIKYEACSLGGLKIGHLEKGLLNR